MTYKYHKDEICKFAVDKNIVDYNTATELLTVFTPYPNNLGGLFIDKNEVQVYSNSSTTKEIIKKFIISKNRNWICIVE